MPKKIITLSLSVLATLLIVTGCSPSASVPQNTAQTVQQPALAELETLSNPKNYFGESTAIMANSDIVPITTDPQPQLPVTMIDNQGTEVTITDISRIVTLDIYGSLSATVYGLGLGDNLVARDTSTGFGNLIDLPLVTQNGHQLNAEALLSVNPSVIITDTSIGPWNVILQMREIGIPVVVIDSERNLGNVSTIIEQVAAALGVEAEGELLAARIQQDIDTKVAEIAEIVPQNDADKIRMVFLYVRGNAGVYYMFGTDSGADSLVTALGGIDVATEIDWQGMRPLNAEALVEMKPDLLLMMTKGLESVNGVDGLLERVPAVANTPAGQNRRIVDMSDYEVLSFGPRAAEVLDALARAIYAPDVSTQ